MIDDQGYDGYHLNGTIDRTVEGIGHWKWLFRPAFGVRSTQMLVKKTKNGPYQLDW